MTTEQFIEKAIEGGWKESFFPRFDNPITKATPGVWLDPHLPTIEWFPLSAILLDPEAWKAVGKVERWRDDEHESNHSFRDRPGSLTRLLYGWEYRWHEMLHDLEEGKSIESYLETL